MLIKIISAKRFRSYGSEVEHFLGKEEVAGSSPAMSSTGLYDFM